MCIRDSRRTVHTTQRNNAIGLPESTSAPSRVWAIVAKECPGTGRREKALRTLAKSTTLLGGAPGVAKEYFSFGLQKRHQLYSHFRLLQRVLGRMNYSEDRRGIPERQVDSGLSACRGLIARFRQAQSVSYPSFFSRSPRKRANFLSIVRSSGPIPSDGSACHRRECRRLS